MITGLDVKGIGKAMNHLQEIPVNFEAEDEGHSVIITHRLTEHLVAHACL